MRISEIVTPTNTTQNAQPAQQQAQQKKRQPVAIEPADAARGRMRREMAKNIAKSRTHVQPTEDDLAIAFMRACQAQNAVDDAAEQTGDYRAKPFNG